MKVLYVLDTLEYGGAEKSTIEIAAHLRDFQPTICHIYNGSSLRSYAAELNVPIVSLNVTKQYGFGEAYKKLRDLIKEVKPDIVVSSLLRSDLVARMVCRNLKVPVLGTMVNENYSPHKLATFNIAQKAKFAFFTFLNKWTSRYCAGFISNSGSISVSHSNKLGIDHKKIIVIPRGRRTEMFDHRRSVDVTRNFIKFVSVGRLKHSKGFADLINTFNDFQKAFSTCSLTIAGEGKYRNELEALVVNHQLQDKVFLPGIIKDIPSFLSEADCFVFPSYYEGFSGAVLEAMLAGVPILASDIDQNTEIIRHLENGYIFKVKDQASLREAMDWFSNNRSLAELLAQKANKEAHELYSLESVAKRHEDYYKQILARESLTTGD